MQAVDEASWLNDHFTFNYYPSHIQQNRSEKADALFLKVAMEILYSINLCGRYHLNNTWVQYCNSFGNPGI